MFSQTRNSCLEERYAIPDDFEKYPKNDKGNGFTND